jgi:hypothetical protein
MIDHAVGGSTFQWRVFVELETRSILYVRPLVSGANGLVYTLDPISKTGNAALTPSAPIADLDILRTQETLQDVTAESPQGLDGTQVKITNFEAPNTAPPTENSGNFFYEVNSDGFAATNAYRHLGVLFHKLESLGYNLSTYFSRAPLPIDVDAVAENRQVNAHFFWGPTKYSFGAAVNGSTVGAAADIRVICHEFSHHILYESTGDGAFAFGEGPGETIGSIFCDPDSKSPDRFGIRPWVYRDRRVDRKVADGYAWGGSHDDGSYDTNEITGTTLFHVYRSIGGDCTPSFTSGWQTTRRWASDYALYVVAGGISTLPGRATNPSTPIMFANELMKADAGTLLFDGSPGGAIRKIIRWAFEKQGLEFETPPAPGAPPKTTAGQPPSVDVYIDDGRNGEYDYLPMFWETTDIWNRLSPDQGSSRETPIINQSNYGYVKIKNRGTQTANNVVVRAYHAKPTTTLVWPDSYIPMITTMIKLPQPIPSGGSTIVGPFEWVPSQIGHEW